MFDANRIPIEPGDEFIEEDSGGEIWLFEAGTDNQTCGVFRNKRDGRSTRLMIYKLRRNAAQIAAPKIVFTDGTPVVKGDEFREHGRTVIWRYQGQVDYDVSKGIFIAALTGQKMAFHFSGLTRVGLPNAEPVATKRPNDYLNEAAKHFSDRNSVYADGYKDLGKIMAALFPNGITLKTENDWNRMHVYLLSIIKKKRYATNFAEGHPDSLTDDMIYVAMLKEFDAA